MSGNAKSGRKSDKVMRDAIRVALNRPNDNDPEKRKYIHGVAEALVNAAVAGDIQAIKEINDRMDGKPVQALAGDPDSPLQMELIRRVIVDPKAICADASDA